MDQYEGWNREMLLNLVDDLKNRNAKLQTATYLPPDNAETVIEMKRDDRRVIAWAESRLNGVGYTTWMQVCETLPQADPFEIALVMDQEPRWWDHLSAEDIARWVRATLAGEPTDDDCDLYREHDRAIGRAAATGSGLSLESYE